MDAELTCSCGNKVAVSLLDAGRELTCTHCQHTLVAPKLSELRKQCAPAPDATPYQTLTKQQIWGRYILGGFVLVLCVMNIMVHWFYSAEIAATYGNGLQYSGVMQTGFVMSFLWFMFFSWFMLTGRIWARMLVLLKVVLALIFSIVFYSSNPHPLVMIEINFDIAFIVCLFTLKT